MSLGVVVVVGGGTYQANTDTNVFRRRKKTNANIPSKARIFLLLQKTLGSV